MTSYVEKLQGKRLGSGEYFSLDFTDISEKLEIVSETQALSLIKTFYCVNRPYSYGGLWSTLSSRLVRNKFIDSILLKVDKIFAPDTLARLYGEIKKIGDEEEGSNNGLDRNMNAFHTVLSEFNMRHKDIKEMLKEIANWEGVKEIVKE